jgi:hypothetical protein
MEQQRLKPEEFATVINKLQVPVIISDIMRGEELLTRDVHYALHESISDLQPDSALLCIAFSARKIVGAQTNPSASLQVLGMECDRIIDDYAAVWLRNAQGGNVSSQDAFDILSTTAEDLESIAELLGNCEVHLRGVDDNAGSMCNIMRIQAQAQAMVAEAYFQMMEDNAGPDMTPVIAEQAASNNVIPFRARRH